MSLKIVETSGLTGPRIICDHCGLEIDRAERGSCRWASIGEDPTGSPAIFLHWHCSEGFEIANPGAWGETDLDAWFVYLAGRTQLNYAGACLKVALVVAVGHEIASGMLDNLDDPGTALADPGADPEIG